MTYWPITDPAATPPAVEAIWDNKPGWLACPAWAAAGGGGAAFD